MAGFRVWVTDMLCTSQELLPVRRWGNYGEAINSKTNRPFVSTLSKIYPIWQNIFLKMLLQNIAIKKNIHHKIFKTHFKGHRPAICLFLQIFLVLGYTECLCCVMICIVWCVICVFWWWWVRDTPMRCLYFKKLSWSVLYGLWLVWTLDEGGKIGYVG